MAPGLPARGGSRTMVHNHGLPVASVVCQSSSVTILTWTERVLAPIATSCFSSVYLYSAVRARLLLQRLVEPAHRLLLHGG